ncbi:MAG: hypothetical protein Q9227_009017 [Pyrenula ochraceoflavens]
MYFLLTSIAFSLWHQGLSALPASSSSPYQLSRRCGPVSNYYGQTPADWVNNDVDSWLDSWINQHSSEISANPGGFAGAFGQYAIGNPDFSCTDDGSDSDCDFDPCDQRVLNDLGPNLRPAYYVIESVSRLHTYFKGLKEAFETASIAAALSKDSWATTFYKDKDTDSPPVLKEVLNAVGIVVGLAASMAALGGGEAAAAVGTVNALYAGAVGAVNPLVSLQCVAFSNVILARTNQANSQDDTFQKSADLGGILGNIVLNGMESFTEANNELMAGHTYGDVGDIRSFIDGGYFDNSKGPDVNDLTDKIDAFLIGTSVNKLWRTMKVFIMGGAEGGGACNGDDSTNGIGNGPRAYSICRDGKSWYLYYWHEGNGNPFTSKQWGYVTTVPGSDQLGQGNYAGVTVSVLNPSIVDLLLSTKLKYFTSQDVINSSLDSYNVAGYNYDDSTAASRAASALQDG